MSYPQRLIMYEAFLVRSALTRRSALVTFFNSTQDDPTQVWALLDPIGRRIVA